MNGAVVWSRRRRHSPRVMAGSRRSRDWGCAEHDWAGPERIGAGPPASARAGSPPRIRRPGAGRQRTISKDPRLLPDLEALVEPTTRGDPQSPLRWTCKSVRHLAQALQAQGHAVSRTLVAHLLSETGYSLQANRKTTEGDSHPDRDAQFGYINTQVTTALAEEQRSEEHTS